mmetsp:Transcript_27554/g.65642  ORF Transcript_27554/g.65642 Transcript_27554/m.65642 type:complete len:293 (-) Transcript_27554:1427-2305(-)
MRGAEPDAEVGGEEELVAVLELVPQVAVDRVRVEVRAPVRPPLRLVVLLDDSEEFEEVGRDRLDEQVVLLRVVLLRSHELDDGSERDRRVEERLGLDDGRMGSIRRHLGVVLVEEFIKLVEVLADARDEHRAVLDHILEALGDLGLAATRDGRRLVAVCPLRHRALEVPLLVLARLAALLLGERVRTLLHHLDLVAAGKEVGCAGLEVCALFLAASGPGDGLLGHAEHGGLRQVPDIRELPVDSIALRLDLDRFAHKRDRVLPHAGRGGLGIVRVHLAEERCVPLVGDLAEV